MSDIKQLPHLIKLLDDDSPVVRKSISQAFAEFGGRLETELARLTDPPNKQEIRQINRMLKEQGMELTVSEAIVSDLEDVRFYVGQLVHHKRYGYRGVIVEYHTECQANKGWYQSNKTQPQQDQPWYYVLVHDAHEVTYAAEVNLEKDNSKLPVNHPLIQEFFGEFQDGYYLRNDRPWPEELG